MSALATFDRLDKPAPHQYVKRSRLGRVGKLPRTITDEEWDNCILVLAEGGTLADIEKMLGCERRTIDANLRLRPDRTAQWHDAKIAALRSSWSLETIEEIFALIASGQAVCEACKTIGKEQSKFMRIVLEDENLTQLLMRAKRISAHMRMEEVLEVADDDKDDVTITGMGNMAAVNRSKLRVDTRVRLAEMYDSKIFGKRAGVENNVNVTINHAAVLEEARRRGTERIARPTRSETYRQEATDGELGSPSLTPPDAGAPGESLTYEHEAGEARPAWDDL